MNSELLEKYMRHVGNREGIDFLPDYYNYEMEVAGITQDEYEALAQASRDAQAALKREATAKYRREEGSDEEQAQRLKELLPALTRDPKDEGERVVDQLVASDPNFARNQSITNIQRILSDSPFDQVIEAASRAGFKFMHEADIWVREIKAQATQRQAWSPAVDSANALKSRIETIRSLIEKDLFLEGNCDDCSAEPVDDSILNTIYSLLTRVAEDAAEIVRTMK